VLGAGGCFYIQPGPPPEVTIAGMSTWLCSAIDVRTHDSEIISRPCQRPPSAKRMPSLSMSRAEGGSGSIPYQRWSGRSSMSNRSARFPAGQRDLPARTPEPACGPRFRLPGQPLRHRRSSSTLGSGVVDHGQVESRFDPVGLVIDFCLAPRRRRLWSLQSRPELIDRKLSNVIAALRGSGWS